MSGPDAPTPLHCPDWMRDWALFLDLDGTLLDLAAEPQAVRVSPGLPAQLAALTRGLGGALALVSGRPLSDIDRLFPGRFNAAGTHGAQWRLGGTLIEPGTAIGAALLEMTPLLRQETARLPGVLLERKPHALALHYRLAPAHEAQVRALATRAAERLGPAFRLQLGKLVVEILPAAAGKGAAIERFMDAPPYAGRTPVFVGDDRTDEDGFAVVNARGGLSRCATVVWCGYPRLDGDPVFCSLLNGSRPYRPAEPDNGGYFACELVGALGETRQWYQINSAVLVTRIEDQAGNAIKVTDFAPRFTQFERMFRPPTLIRRLTPVKGRPQLRVRVRPRFAYGQESPQVTVGSNHVRYQSQTGALRLTTDAPLSYVVEETPFLLEGPLTFILGADESLTAGIAETARHFLERTLDHWHNWVRAPYAARGPSGPV